MMPCAHVWGINFFFLLMLKLDYMNRSHKTSVVQNTHVPQNTACAVLRRSVARLSSLFPLPTFSVVENESCTSCSMCADCTLRLFANVVCSSDISSNDFSVALDIVSKDAASKRFCKEHIPNFVKLVFVLFEHVLVLLGKQLQLLRVKLLFNHAV